MLPIFFHKKKALLIYYGYEKRDTECLIILLLSTMPIFGGAASSAIPLDSNPLGCYLSQDCFRSTSYSFIHSRNQKRQDDLA